MIHLLLSVFSRNSDANATEEMLSVYYMQLYMWNVLIFHPSLKGQNVCFRILPFPQGFFKFSKNYSQNSEAFASEFLVQQMQIYE